MSPRPFLVTWLAGIAVLGIAMQPGAAQEAATPKSEEAEAAIEKATALEEQAAGTAETTETAEPITPAEAEAVDPEGDAPLDEALVCLARSVYWEARGQEVADMEGVASVVLNRVAADDFPDTVCGVVTDGQEDGSCQFGWWCDGSPDDVEEPEPYEIAMDVARRALNGELADPTDGALYFLGSGEHPEWTSDMEQTAEIGGHVFFRPKAAE
jgi:spore germination cell wall hydrolase CwlJ-like protein